MKDATLSIVTVEPSNDKLISFCKEVKYKFKLISTPYWTAELYGFGEQISKYGFYPYFLPLCVYTDHGPGYYDEIPKHELESHALAHFYHSPISVEKWSQIVTNKKIYGLYSPFIFYRKRKKLEKKSDAIGTIAFPAHSTPSIDDVGGYANYIESLKQLPVQFHPIVICMHMHDINKGKHIDFIKNGFEVVTAGNSLDQRFIPRFYEIIRHFKYATSNIPGSYLYYCVEMGIPFFTYGKKPEWVNKSDENLTAGSFDPFMFGYGKEAYDLFYLTTVFEKELLISDAQKLFVRKHSGIETSVSRLQMTKILYSSFFRWMATKEGFFHTVRTNIVTLILRKMFRFIKKLN